MVSRLKGEIIGKGKNYVEIEVGGVGYMVYVAENMANSYCIGDRTELFTRMIVSENDISLYGFGKLEEVEVFTLLRTVSGVGPKTAMQIVGAGEWMGITRAIGQADVKFFEKIKGIGKKTAQRIIIDLKSKIGGEGELDLKDNTSLKHATIKEDDVYLSLKQLDFDKKEIEKVMLAMPKDLETVEERVGWCLRNL